MMVLEVMVELMLVNLWCLNHELWFNLVNQGGVAPPKGYPRSAAHARQLMRDVQRVGDAVAHEDDETQHFQDSHGPAHKHLGQGWSRSAPRSCGSWVVMVDFGLVAGG